MNIVDRLDKRIDKTEWLVVAESVDRDDNLLAILENQMQIMCGLKAILCGGFVPYDDAKEQG